MKPLHELSNIERAKLLFELFPSEMPAAVAFIGNMAITTIEEKERLRVQWQNALFTFDSWINIVMRVQLEVDRHTKQLTTSSYFFSRRLFSGYLACFSAYCLDRYVTDIQHPNRKFSIAVSLLFTFYPYQ